MIVSYIRGLLNIFNLKMGSLVPDTVRGMKHLDREKFLRNVSVSVLKVSNEKLTEIIPICKPYTLKLERFKLVQSLTEEHKPFDKCIFLNPEKVTGWNDISENDRLLLNQSGITEDNFDSKEIQVKYENFKYDDIFKAVLPEDAEKVSGFSQIGHIIHLNLRDHLLEYKTLIGTVLIDKIKTCKTVVNKRHAIQNTYRNFQMELLAGEEDFFVTVKENGCKFQFDFSKVYWNPRLCEEHKRIIDCLKAHDVLFDIFCGVGPFAVPAAKKKCRVFANDLNPDSYNWLNHNAKYNRVNMYFFKSYNMDAKEFILGQFKEFITRCCRNNEEIGLGSRIHVAMNLPGLAVEFLKYFIGLIDRDLIDDFKLNIVAYVYCFASVDASDEEMKQIVITNMGKDVSSDILSVEFVRNVSPKKNMIKITLKLSKEILIDISNSELELGEPIAKKKCVKSIEESVP